MPASQKAFTIGRAKVNHLISRVWLPEGQMLTSDYRIKLKNRLFGLLCEYEKDRAWQKFLDSILIELDGFEDEMRTTAYYHLYHNLSACRYLSYEYFRSTIFDCMNLVDKI